MGRAAGNILPLLRLHGQLIARLCSAGWRHRLRAMSGVLASLVRYRRAGDGADLAARCEPGSAELPGPRHPSHLSPQRRGGALGEQALPRHARTARGVSSLRGACSADRAAAIADRDRLAARAGRRADGASHQKITNGAGHCSAASASLHRGRRFEDGRDVYPEILESWSQ